MFYRLFFSVQNVADGQVQLELRLSPDAKQAHCGPAVTMISCSTFDDLGVCLADLGVTGWSRPAGESAGGPLGEYVQGGAAELLERLKTAKLSSLTLIAAETSVQEMNQRVALLKTRDRLGIQTKGPV